MGARTQNKAGKDHRADAELLGIYVPGRLTHGLRRWFISTCRNASARTEVVELMTHNAKGEVIDAYTSWEWSTLCGEVSKLEVELHPASLIVLPVAKSETTETTAVSHQVFASDFATRDQSEVISDGYRWRRWESNSRQFARFRRFSNGFADRYLAGHVQRTRTKRVTGHSYDNVTNPCA